MCIKEDQCLYLLIYQSLSSSQSTSLSSSLSIWSGIMFFPVLGKENSITKYWQVCLKIACRNNTSVTFEDDVSPQQLTFLMGFVYLRKEAVLIREHTTLKQMDFKRQQDKEQTMLISIVREILKCLFCTFLYQSWSAGALKNWCKYLRKLITWGVQLPRLSWYLELNVGFYFDFLCVKFSEVTWYHMACFTGMAL